ncbi:MAG TPA: SRPBCC domain-containing protein [Steroidobacteraceae bacterium]|nr:SRPBCC domain-containing protein [Steroidobacteraceae bacterium]
MDRNYKLAMCAAALTCASMGGGRAAADVLNVAANGFEVRETTHTTAPPDQVYAALLLPARWWNSDHTFSRSAANLVLDARAGGCWCETLPNGGSVEHMRVVFVAPGKTLRLRGALGPLQGLAVDGAMTWSIQSVPGGTDVSLTYAVGGYVKDGFDDLSKGVDHVLGEQLVRLKKLIDGETAPH